MRNVEKETEDARLRKFKKQLDRALTEMEGADTVSCLVMISWLVSFGATAYGIHNMQIDEFKKFFAGTAVFFLMSQSFVVVKLLRDASFGSLTDHRGMRPAGAEFVRHHPVYLLVVLVSFLMAFFCAMYGIGVSMPAEEEDRLFLVLATFYMLAASFNLANMLRDRFDAGIWRDEAKAPQTKQAGTTAIESVLVNSMRMATATLLRTKILFCCTMMGAAGITMYALGTFPIKEYRGFVMAGVLFMMASTWNAAKVLEDDQQEEDACHKAFAGISMVGSIALCLVGVNMMQINDHMKLTLLLGMLCTLDSTFSVTKTTNRERKIEKLSEDLAEQGIDVE